jgi:hypothetical protein
LTLTCAEAEQDLRRAVKEVCGTVEAVCGTVEERRFSAA